jgi:hypothetical protein
MDRSEKTILLVLVSLLLVACCLLVLCGGIFYLVTGGLGFFSQGVDLRKSPTPEAVFLPTPTVTSPTPTVGGSDSQGEGGVWVNEEFSDTLTALQNAQIPSADLVYLAERYEGKTGIPLQLTAEPVAYRLGDRLDFFKLNVDTNTTERVTAVLRYASNRVYFWVEDGLNVSSSEINRVLSEFESRIYPTNQEFFGQEWMPGVDNDPHVYILYASNMGTNLAGYTASTDTVVPQAHEYSNAHEMFYINSDVQTLSDPYTLSVMAHELQHLIHGYHDPNEDLWMNEGFSELATLLNGYDAGGFDNIFAFNTDVQLNDWSVIPSVNNSHYGASFLFVTYLLERFGEDFTKALVADQLSGFSSIDHILSAFDHKDSETGDSLSADDVFMDWTITNFMNDEGFGDGRYVYRIYQEAPKATVTETLVECSNVQLDRKVHQYGTDYLRLACAQDGFDLKFSGAQTVAVLPVSTGAGRFMWSNRADASVTRLSREFDFSKVTGPIMLEYNVWYDLESDYDFLYLIASQGDRSERILHTPSCSLSDTTGNSFGCGYNGSSYGWTTEQVDLSEFAGSMVTLSFEYVTDEAVTGEGFIIDNIRIAEIGYQTDFEQDAGGWKGEGFVHINNILPQTFLVSIIDTYNDVLVGKYVLDSGDKLQLHLESLPQGYDYILVVSGSSRHTRQQADYEVILNQ